MTFKTDDRVYETSVTTGTGTYTLDGAPTGFQAFSSMTANNYCPYFATDGTNWEVGIGQVLAGPARLARDAVISSSNADAAVNWGAGTKNIRCGWPAFMALPRTLSKAIAGSGTTVLTQDEQRRSVIEFTGLLTGNRVIEVDATPWEWASVYNNTTGAYTLTFKVTGQTGVTITQGKKKNLVCNGTDVVEGFNDVTIPAATTTTVPCLLENLGLAVTMAANAVTIALKGADGNDPSASNVVGVSFRNATITNGQASKVQHSAALSTVISSGSTGGTVNAVASRIWVAAILNAGAIELAWMNPTASDGTVTAIDETALISTTAEGGAGAADTAGVWYSTTARASVPFVVIGNFESTQATAGTWASAASKIATNPRTLPSGSGWTTVASGSIPAAASFDVTNIPLAPMLRVTLSAASLDTSSRAIRIRASTDNGSSFYSGATDVLGSAAGNLVNDRTTDGLSQAAANTSNLVMTIFQHDKGWIDCRGYARESGGTALEINSRLVASGAALTVMNALRFLISGSGNFDGGTYSVEKYG